MAQALRQSDLSDLFKRQVEDAQQTLHSLGETLPVTLKLPTKTITPGALQPKPSDLPLSRRRMRQLEAD